MKAWNYSTFSCNKGKKNKNSKIKINYVFLYFAKTVFEMTFSRNYTVFSVVHMAAFLNSLINKLSYKYYEIQLERR
jgi:hypothetical protein